MILIRWCIPDMHPKLRDQIRREAYITNETIIRQEALRASGICTDLNVNGNRWNRVTRTSMSNSEFDLEIHGIPVPSTNVYSRVGPAAL